jgi:hypothetical protein
VLRNNLVLRWFLKLGQVAIFFFVKRICPGQPGMFVSLLFGVQSEREAGKIADYQP